MYCYNDAVIDTELKATFVVYTTAAPFTGSALADPARPYVSKDFAGACPNGYKCKTGATIAYQNIQWDSTQDNYLCKTGQYCDNTQSVTENNCPAGTYMPRIGATVLLDCVPCKPGFQCSSDGLTSPLSCTTGHSCDLGTGSAAKPPVDCPIGSYCPANAAEAFKCAWGYTAAATT